MSLQVAGLEIRTIPQRQDVPGRQVMLPDKNHWALKGGNSCYIHHEVHDRLAMSP